jgi:hypothetical protein
MGGNTLEKLPDTNSDKGSTNNKTVIIMDNIIKAIKQNIKAKKLLLFRLNRNLTKDTIERINSTTANMGKIINNILICYLPSRTFLSL